MLHRTACAIDARRVGTSAIGYHGNSWAFQVLRINVFGMIYHIVTPSDSGTQNAPHTLLDRIISGSPVRSLLGIIYHILSPLFGIFWDPECITYLTGSYHSWISFVVIIGSHLSYWKCMIIWSTFGTQNAPHTRLDRSIPQSPALSLLGVIYHTVNP